MKSKNLFKIFVIFIFILLFVNIYIIFLFTPQLTAQEKYQKMSEINVNPNIPEAGKAIIPENFGELKGIENVGRSTMLWFESRDGTIRRVNISFWEDEIILDDLVVVIKRR